MGGGGGAGLAGLGWAVYSEQQLPWQEVDWCFSSPSLQEEPLPWVYVAGADAGVGEVGDLAGLGGWVNGWVCRWLVGWLIGWLVGWLVGLDKLIAFPCKEPLFRV